MPAKVQLHLRMADACYTPGALGLLVTIPQGPGASCEAGVGDLPPGDMAGPRPALQTQPRHG